MKEVKTIYFSNYILTNHISLNSLNDKIEMVNNNLHFFVALIGTSVAIAGVAFYFITKQIVHSTAEKELPNVVKNNPQIQSFNGKLNLIPTYNYELNRFRLGKINIASENIINKDNILYISLYYYDSFDIEDIQSNNISLSSNQLDSLSRSKYKVEITKYTTTIDNNSIIIEIDEDDVPTDIYFNIIYKNY